mmetsp:Transcript_12083/g.17425  ORF Transcript_12083/g.17425 Transcript_12083/m.17425 type:complete len:80 (-) Transcript_12083:748-987(-)|eukprot:CAMPEP_0172434394 /NCGR_PEP_ID=MMETSP1064-20121228/70608_1 /TAXON_ID=202472 /ORGANISM="Aulacoseira subarctica , Strain CCAP 1002/5" /LENGTH=79 /DNA_ID=CAMNT_0013182609 /DNA_START=455 /DNA_END=694 /DNA_ORIENTATION=-
MTAASKTIVAASKVPWRQLKGMNWVMYEAKHPGNQPFVIGFGVCLLGSMYLQTTFTDEQKKSSVYWSTFHLTDDKKGHH